MGFAKAVVLVPVTAGGQAAAMRNRASCGPGLVAWGASLPLLDVEVYGPWLLKRRSYAGSRECASPSQIK